MHFGSHANQPAACQQPLCRAQLRDAMRKDLIELVLATDMKQVRSMNPSLPQPVPPRAA